MLSRHLISVALVLAAVTFGGLAFAQQPATAVSDRNHASDHGEYRIGPEDVVQISVWKNDAMSRTVPVRPDGKISLPLLNEVQAAGLTPTELRAYLMKKLTEYIPNPEVSVIVTEVHSFKVSVLGEVKAPGRHELKSRATVVDLIAQAGGFTEFASRSRIVILRRQGNTMKRIFFNYNQVLSGDGEGLIFFLQPGDIIMVP